MKIRSLLSKIHQSKSTKLNDDSRLVLVSNLSNSEYAAAFEDSYNTLQSLIKARSQKNNIDLKDRAVLNLLNAMQSSLEEAQNYAIIVNAVSYQQSHENGYYKKSNVLNIIIWRNPNEAWLTVLNLKIAVILGTGIEIVLVYYSRVQ